MFAHLECSNEREIKTVRFSQRVASPAILHPVPVIAAELVEGDPEGPDGEAVDYGVGRGREEAEAEHAELYKEENIESVFGFQSRGRSQYQR